MADNQVTLSPLVAPGSTTGAGSAGLTLDAFRRIMHYNAQSFMGVSLQGHCPPFDCEKRDLFVQAARSAVDMIEAQLLRHHQSVFNAAVTLSSGAPYFKLDGHIPYTITTHRYSGVVTLDPATQIATVTVTIIPLEAGEEFVSAAVLFTGCNCLRLDVELCDDPVLTGNVLTLQARDYNFIDVDNATYYPSDAIEYLSTVTVEVVTRTATIPKAKWTPALVCTTTTPDPNCQYNETTGCLIERQYSLYDVRNYLAGALCGDRLHHFEAAVTRVGGWRASWADAVVSLINTMLPVDYCECEPLANTRYRDDNGLSPVYEKVYAYSWNNPFGILKPGAMRAWKAIETVLNGTEVYKN